MYCIIFPVPSHHATTSIQILHGKWSTETFIVTYQACMWPVLITFLRQPSCLGVIRFSQSSSGILVYKELRFRMFEALYKEIQKGYAFDNLI